MGLNDKIALSDQSATAILYSNKIVIDTMNKRDDSTRYTNGNPSILSLEISDLKLGQSVVEHLGQSKLEYATQEQIKNLWIQFKKKCKFRSDKEFMKDARSVSIYVYDTSLILVASRNRFSQRTFFPIPDSSIELNPMPEFQQIGESLREAWQRCYFID